MSFTSLDIFYRTKYSLYIETFEECSKDSCGGTYLVHNQTLALNFDKVVEHKIKSCDSLYFSNTQSSTQLIEFKNSAFGNYLSEIIEKTAKSIDFIEKETIREGLFTDFNSHPIKLVIVYSSNKTNRSNYTYINAILRRGHFDAGPGAEAFNNNFIAQFNLKKFSYGISFTSQLSSVQIIFDNVFDRYVSNL